jgi:hypothetical protein
VSEGSGWGRPVLYFTVLYCIVVYCTVLYCHSGCSSTCIRDGVVVPDMAPAPSSNAMAPLHVSLALSQSPFACYVLRPVLPPTVSAHAVGLTTKRAEQRHLTSACQGSLDPCPLGSMTGTVTLCCAIRGRACGHRLAGMKSNIVCSWSAGEVLMLVSGAKGGRSFHHHNRQVGWRYLHHQCMSVTCRPAWPAA